MTWEKSSAFVLVHPHQFLVEPQRRGAGGQPEHGVRLGVEHVGHDRRGRPAHFFVRGQDDDFHGAFLGALFVY